MSTRLLTRRRSTQRRLQRRNIINQFEGEGNWGTEWWHQLITVELLIGGIVVLWYIWSYVYYTALYSSYKIPEYYLDISLVKLLKPSIRLVFGFTFYYLALYNSWKTRTIMRFGASFYLLVLSILCINPFPTNENVLLIYLVAPIVVFLIDFVRMNWKKKKSVREMISDYNRYMENARRKKNNTNTLLSGIFLIIMIVLSPFLPFLRGSIDAFTKTEYYVIEKATHSSSGSKVVLETYQNFYIVAPLNKDKKTFKPIFELIPMYDDDQNQKQGGTIELKYEKIGPLKPEQ